MSPPLNNAITSISGELYTCIELHIIVHSFDLRHCKNEEKFFFNNNNNDEVL